MIHAIVSNKAKCKDCHRCIRACPVKAIGLHGGQARIIQERCIVCGTCVDACPQGAKTIQSQRARVGDYLTSGRKVHVSLAPSYVAAFPGLTPGQVIAGLKALGFARIEETASAAEHIASHYRRLIETDNGPHISSCCPAVINLLEIYYPELLPMASTTVSPMVLHGRLIHRDYPEDRVVFIGPCVAKIQEASRADSYDAIDAVITFAELRQWWRERGIAPERLESMTADRPTTTARIFPLSRGILASAGLRADELPDVITVQGLEECLETFNDLIQGSISPRFIEALACAGGCIGGTGMGDLWGIAARRSQVLSYHHAPRTVSTPSPRPDTETRPKAPASRPQTELEGLMTRVYHERPVSQKSPSEREIRAILAQIGKKTEQDESNCGGCGYPTCRDKAVATYQGLAELEMCVPYMKAKFESLSHLVVDGSVNAIIIVNRDLTIHRFNPTAQHFFNPSNQPTRGMPLSAFLDPSDFEQVLETGVTVRKRVAYREAKLVTHQTIYAVPEYDLVIGVIFDITDDELRKQELERKHQSTIERATSVINNQMKLAQEIAGLLGEATSETKATLLELITMLADDKESGV